MTTLLDEVRDLLAKRVRTADPRELFTIATGLDVMPQPPINNRHVAPDCRPFGYPLDCPYVKASGAGRLLPLDATDWVLVLDTRTDLFWSRGPVSTTGVRWEAALQAAEEFTIAAPIKFYAPTLRERLFINDYTRIEPALDTRFFDSPASGWEWTSTPWAPSPAGNAWIVYVRHGLSGWASQNNEGFVRACAPRQ